MHPYTEAQNLVDGKQGIKFAWPYRSYSAKKIDGGNFDEFYEQPAIRQSFHVNTFPMKPTNNSSKFCSSKFRACTICQSFSPSNFCASYTVIKPAILVTACPPCRHAMKENYVCS